MSLQVLEAAAPVEEGAVRHGRGGAPAAGSPLLHSRAAREEENAACGRRCWTLLQVGRAAQGSAAGLFLSGSSRAYCSKPSTLDAAVAGSPAITVVPGREWVFFLNECSKRMKKKLFSVVRAEARPPALNPHLSCQWCSGTKGRSGCSLGVETHLVATLHEPPSTSRHPSAGLVEAEGGLCWQVCEGRPEDLPGLLVVHKRPPARGGRGLL